MITYHRLVTAKDIPSLDSDIKKRIKSAIDQKLSINPLLYGEPLHGALKHVWKLRVGDWRVVYIIEPKETFVIAIAHRKDIYKIVLRRL